MPDIANQTVSGHHQMAEFGGSRVDRYRRIDPPHAMRGEKADQSAAAQQLPPASSEAIALHAEQLAESLQVRQRDLDRREARLNARAAAMDDELRTGRMKLIDRQQQLDQRQFDLDRRSQELQQLQIAISAAEASLEADWHQFRAQAAECPSNPLASPPAVISVQNTQ